MDQIVSYLRFVRLKRSHFLRDISLTFMEAKDKRVVEPTYSQEEVLQLLQSLESLTKSDMERELVSLSHTNVLLLQQYFAQAEAWHLTLTSNVGQLENRSLIEAVAQFEEQQFSTKPKESSTANAGAGAKLAPILDAGALALFQQEVEKLKAENAQLKAKGGPTSSAKEGGDAETQALKLKITSLEEDLNAKLQASKPVQNLKKILSKKNEDLKQLRQRLAKLDPTFDPAAIKDDDETF